MKFLITVDISLIFFHEVEIYCPVVIRKIKFTNWISLQIKGFTFRNNEKSVQKQ